jgi:hypothetical protein
MAYRKIYQGMSDKNLLMASSIEALLRFPHSQTLSISLPQNPKPLFSNPDSRTNAESLNGNQIRFAVCIN